ncbi:hypothetical protein HY029_01505 [Candidatus Gottesmanbacteria bacterium]|nr:hypothetical protein [Candidatus Gottesmanbacteria bacterium]
MPVNNPLSTGRKVLITLLIVSFFFIGFTASYKYVHQQFAKAQSKTPSIPTPAPINLALTAVKNTVNKGKYISVTLNLATGNQTLDAADFVVNFDPKYLQVAKIFPGNFFKTYPSTKMDKDFIKITGIATLSGNSVFIPKGTGTVAIISFLATEKTPKTSITIDKVKTVLASGGNNLKNRLIFSDLDLTIN